MTPLHACALAGGVGGEGLVALLADRGADPFVRNRA